LVAALPGEHVLDQRVVIAHAHPGDEVPTGAAQVGEVVGAGEAAVDHGDDPSETWAALRFPDRSYSCC
jgi:hypothetical protein